MDNTFISQCLPTLQVQCTPFALYLLMSLIKNSKNVKKHKTFLNLFHKLFKKLLTVILKCTNHYTLYKVLFSVYIAV